MAEKISQKKSDNRKSSDFPSCARLRLGNHPQSKTWGLLAPFGRSVGFSKEIRHPPSKTGGIARSLRSLGRISKHATILDGATAPTTGRRLDGMAAFKYAPIPDGVTDTNHRSKTGWNGCIQKDAAPIVLRMGLSLVILWFGFNQIFNAPYWVGWLPSWHHHMMIAPSSLVISNGIFEVIFGGLLLLGIFTRISAAILATHILFIALNLGYTDVAIRDFGLAIMAAAVFLHGDDRMCFGRKLKNMFSRKKILSTIL